jgi:hypothetical protein
MSEDGPAQRAALWDTWEQAEGRTSSELKEIYRAALHTHGVAAPDAYLTFMAVAMVGGSWTGDEVREGARKVQQGVATNYRTERDRQAARKPMQEQIRREVADGAAGKTREQVRDELSAAYTAHGLEPLPAAALGAEAIRIIRPGWRDGLLALRDRRAFLESVMGLSYPAKPDPEATAAPEWARPPAGTTRGPDGPQVVVRVELTADGTRVLSQLIGEWQPKAIDHQLVCWLTVGEGASDPVVVHLGPAEVGRLGAHASDLARESVAAAQTARHSLANAALLAGDGSAEHPFLLRLRLLNPRPEEPD